MSTKTHKPATTSDIVTTPKIQQPNNSPAATNSDVRSASPRNRPIQQSTNPFSATTRSRCGKVARLPKEIRDQLNEMLLDGVPHAQIIQKLQQTFGTPQPNVLPLDTTDASSNPETPSSPTPDSVNHETRNTQHDSGPQNPVQIENQNGRTDSVSKIEILSSLTPHHITNWKKFGGYRDWLRDQQRIEECKIRHELTLDLARSAEGLASYQAAPKVAVAQICQTIIDLGPDGLKDAMKASPLNCFRLLNALARLINSGLKCEQQIQKTTTKQRGGMTRARFARIEKNLNLM